MKTSYLILALITSTIISSCTKHEKIIDTSFQPGNILCSDGSIIHPSEYKNSSKQAVGIVFWCNNIQDTSTSVIGYAISLQDLPAEQLINTSENISSVSEDETSFDGEANTAAIKEFAEKDSIECPAITSVYNYVPYGYDGWYIGSVAQYKIAALNYPKIKATLDVVGQSDYFSGTYWTSTENGSGEQTSMFFAYTIHLENGTVSSSNKMKTNKIRPIITIR